MADPEQHWHIAGIGAIGALSVAHSISQKLKITPIVRANSLSYCKSFVNLAGKQIALPAPSFAPDIKSINNLLVPLKSYDVLPFLSSVQHLLDANSQVVLCHNGMGTIEQALDILPSCANLYFCTSSHGVYKKDRKAHYAGAGESTWKLIRAGNDRVLSNEQMNKILPNAKVVENLDTLLWQKLIINCAINPLTALYQVKNGELANAEYQSEVTEIVKEAVQVANACSINIQYSAMLDKVKQVILHTGSNTSSMLQDVMNKRPTEIEFITGYLLEQAKRQGLTVTTNHSLYQKVKALP